MFSITTQKILEFIKKNEGISPKDIVAHLGLNASGIFRHLKKMEKDELLYKVGKPPKVRYYSYTHTMDTESKLLSNAINWAVSGDARLASPDQLCETRDIFQARSNRLLNDLKRIVKNENLVYLIVAAIGEIGNNSFDHNIGRWRDVTGIFFGLDEKTRTIVIADRGQGVQATLKQVRPKIQSDAEALNVAFLETVSGRDPEQRGNGLKFVKKVVEENQLYLKLYTGKAVAEITKPEMKITESDASIPGTLTYLIF